MVVVAHIALMRAATSAVSGGLFLRFKLCVLAVLLNQPLEGTHALLYIDAEPVSRIATATADAAPRNFKGASRRCAFFIAQIEERVNIAPDRPSQLYLLFQQRQLC